MNNIMKKSITLFLFFISINAVYAENCISYFYQSKLDICGCFIDDKKGGNIGAIFDQSPTPFVMMGVSSCENISDRICGSLELNSYKNNGVIYLKNKTKYANDYFKCTFIDGTVISEAHYPR